MDVNMQTSVVALLSLVITSISGIILAWITYKTQALGRDVKHNTTLTAETAETMKELEKNTNNKFDKLLQLTSESARAEGKLQARQEDRDATAAIRSHRDQNS